MFYLFVVVNYNLNHWFELILVGKESLSSELFEQWAELLMKEAVPTATKRRRLVGLQADVPLQKQAQEQLVFDALVYCSKESGPAPAVCEAHGCSVATKS